MGRWGGLASRDYYVRMYGCVKKNHMRGHEVFWEIANPQGSDGLCYGEIVRWVSSVAVAG